MIIINIITCITEKIHEIDIKITIKINIKIKIENENENNIFITYIAHIWIPGDGGYRSRSTPNRRKVEEPGARFDIIGHRAF